MAEETELDSTMRTLLMQLALTSNGTTATVDANRGGGSARYYEHAILADTLHPGDEPHKVFERRYNEATTRAEREIVIEQARERLNAIRRSRPRPTVFETLDEKQEWIVRHCEGLNRQQAAVSAYTGVKVVYAARVKHGREPDYGRETNAIRYANVDERRRRVRELAEQGMSATSIAKQLGLAYSTVRRDLGKKR